MESDVVQYASSYQKIAVTVPDYNSQTVTTARYAGASVDFVLNVTIASLKFIL